MLQPDQLARIMGLVPYSKLGVPVAWKIEISQSWNGVTITFCVDPLVVAAAKVKVREFQAELQHVLDTMKPYLPDFKYHARVRKEIKQVLGTIRLRRPNEE